MLVYQRVNVGVHIPAWISNKPDDEFLSSRRDLICNSTHRRCCIYAVFSGLGFKVFRILVLGFRVSGFRVLGFQGFRA